MNTSHVTPASPPGHDKIADHDEIADHDVIVVGSGAGGSAATAQLVNAGLRVLLVDKGDVLPRDGSTLDVQRVVHDGEFKSREDWQDGDGKVLRPEEYFNVGGKTKWYGAALARFSPAEFAADAAHQCPAWPITYADMAPYYASVEAALGVRMYPCEGDLNGMLKRLQQRGKGWQVDALPIGLDPRILQNAQEARHFDGFASPQGFKGDGEQSFLRPVLNAPNLLLRTHAGVHSLLADPARPNHIAGVRLDDGSKHFARAVILAAGALHTPRIVQRFLKQQRLMQLPLAKIAGKNLKLHLLTAVMALSASPKTDLLRKTRILFHADMPHSSVQPLGFDGELLATLIPGFVPRPIARMIGSRAYGFFLQTEDGSDMANGVTDADLREAPNAPRLPLFDFSDRRVAAARHEHTRLVHRLRRDLLRAGYPNFAQRIGLQGTAHACGTMVCGSDPKSSACDGYGQVHGLSGLWVMDGSVLPRSSRVNPALTIYAFSMRAAERLAQQLSAGRDINKAAPNTARGIAL